MEEDRRNHGQNGTATGPGADADCAANGAFGAAERTPGREMGIEETLTELEALIEKMEDRSSSLEDIFACYERGMKLVKEVSGKIDRVEKRLMILTEDGQNDGV